jgi:hypothetical protein
MDLISALTGMFQGQLLRRMAGAVESLDGFDRSIVEETKGISSRWKSTKLEVDRH